MTLAAPTSTTALQPGAHARPAPRTALDKPTGAFPATRWLFARLALLSLVVTLPLPLLSAGPAEAGVVLLASGVLAASWTIGYLRGGTSVAADVVDTFAVLAFALAGDPSVVFAALISALWFRSLDGSALRAYVRPVAYSLAIVVALVLWPYVGDRTATAGAVHVLATIPMLFLTVVVARRLAWTFRDRQRRDAVATVYAAAIEKLLGLTEGADIRRVAAEADHGFCAVVPGLRIAKGDLHGDDLIVQGVRGEWADAPGRVPVALIGDGRTGDPVEHRVTDPALLDRYAGATCAWVALSLPVVPELGLRSWLLVGAPGTVPVPVVRALRNLANHIALAYAVAEAHEALTDQATTDALTGVANRAAFTAALEAALADPAQDQVSVLFVDIDAFKEINDSLGHHAGDQALREVATRLRLSLIHI